MRKERGNPLDPRKLIRKKKPRLFMKANGANLPRRSLPSEVSWPRAMCRFPGSSLPVSPSQSVLQWLRETWFPAKCRSSYSGGAAPDLHRTSACPPRIKLWDEHTRGAESAQVTAATAAGKPSSLHRYLTTGSRRIAYSCVW
jgi:hypothetical protein